MRHLTEIFINIVDPPIDLKLIIKKDIISELVKFGFDETDALIYLCLVQAGGTTVTNVASKIGVDRTKVYRSLSKLRNLGVVNTTFSNPIRVKAIPPKHALTNIIKTKETELSELHKMANVLVKRFDELKQPHPNLTTPYFSIVQGRSNIYSRIIRLLDDSKNSVFIVTSTDDILRMYHTGIPEKIKENVRKGKKIKVLTNSQNNNVYSYVNKLNAYETRVTDNLPSDGRIIVEENRSLVMSGSAAVNIGSSVEEMSGEPESVIDTNSLAMVKNVHALCLHLWDNAKPLQLVRNSREK